MNRAEAARALARSAALLRGSRLRRTAAQPVRAVLPTLLRAAGATRTVAARTFWGGTMDVVLPETVSTHIWRFGFYDENVCAFLMSALRPGMSFLDVGGHFGFFSLLGSALVGPDGRVAAMEPIPSTSERLGRNAARAEGAPVAVVRAAAHSADGELDFMDFGVARSAYNSAFGDRDGSGGGARVRCAARRVDTVLAELGWDACHVVKIDAESAEHHVLDGMRGTLERHRPLLIVEVGDFGLPGVPPSRTLVDRLVGEGLRGWEWRDGALRPHEPAATYRYTNLLFAPAGWEGASGVP